MTDSPPNLPNAELKRFFLKYAIVEGIGIMACIGVYFLTRNIQIFTWILIAVVIACGAWFFVTSRAIIARAKEGPRIVE